MNRLPNAKRTIVEAALRGGFSFRKTAILARVHINTVISTARRIGVAAMLKKKGIRHRTEYQKLWLKSKGVPHMMLTQRNDIVRASVALFLARSVRPMSKEQVFSAMLKEFPWLKEYSITNMLRTNADHCFKEIEGRFTFEPSPFYFPGVNFKPGKERGKYYQLMDAARAAWFDAVGIKDEHVEQLILKLKQQNEEFIYRRRNEMFESKVENWNKQLSKFRKP